MTTFATIAMAAILALGLTAFAWDAYRRWRRKRALAEYIRIVRRK